MRLNSFSRVNTLEPLLASGPASLPARRGFFCDMNYGFLFLASGIAGKVAAYSSYSVLISQSATSGLLDPSPTLESYRNYSRSFSKIEPTSYSLLS